MISSVSSVVFLLFLRHPSLPPCLPHHLSSPLSPHLPLILLYKSALADDTPPTGAAMRFGGVVTRAVAVRPSCGRAVKKNR